MSIFQTYFDDIKRHYDYDDHQVLTKRIIDLTLDTDNIAFYKKTINFLDWTDRDPDNTIERKHQLQELLDELYLELKDKPIYTTNQTHLLSVQNLVRSYRKSSFALGPISFNLKEGEILGLVGENGNGKTTLLRSLCGELLPTSGIIQYSFSYKNIYDLRSHLIYIPQRTPSWPGSLLSNLQFTASSYGMKGEKNELLVQLIIARMELRKFRNYSWKNLSSGYKMRFELARALLRKPKLLLIDEPLANLDILAQQIVLDDFKDIVNSPFRPLGIILSSQQLYEVEKTSNNVIFLKNGTPRNLMQDTDAIFTEISKFIIEFESEWGQNILRKELDSLKLEKLQINGGTYIATFPNDVNLEDFLKLILDKHIPITYFRNISNSTRRFFLS